MSKHEKYLVVQVYKSASASKSEKINFFSHTSSFKCQSINHALLFKFLSQFASLKKKNENSVFGQIIKSIFRTET